MAKGDAAFPVSDGAWEHGEMGLSKRELFAAMAMQGLRSAIYSSKEMLDDFTTEGHRYLSGREAVTKNALSYADALLAALSKDKAT